MSVNATAIVLAASPVHPSGMKLDFSHCKYLDDLSLLFNSVTAPAIVVFASRPMAVSLN